MLKELCIKKITASSCSYYGQTKYGSTSLCDQNCGLQSEDRQTNRQTETQTDATRTDKKLKTEGPMIFSNDIFYFKTVMIIGGPTRRPILFALTVSASILLLIKIEHNIHLLVFYDKGIIIFDC